MAACDQSYGGIVVSPGAYKIPPLSQISSQNAADALGGDRRMYRRLSEAGRGRIARICHQTRLKSCKKSLTMWPLIPYRFFGRIDPRFDIFYYVVKRKLRKKKRDPRHCDLGIKEDPTRFKPSLGGPTCNGVIYECSIFVLVSYNHKEDSSHVVCKCILKESFDEKY